MCVLRTYPGPRKDHAKLSRDLKEDFCSAITYKTPDSQDTIEIFKKNGVKNGTDLTKFSNSSHILSFADALVRFDEELFASW